MNQLNSIILEGSIEKVEKVDDVINATISVKRFYKNAEGDKEFSKVFVVAEHIEFKYMANKSEKTA